MRPFCMTRKEKPRRSAEYAEADLREASLKSPAFARLTTRGIATLTNNKKNKPGDRIRCDTSLACHRKSSLRYERPAPQAQGLSLQIQIFASAVVVSTCPAETDGPMNDRGRDRTTSRRGMDWRRSACFVRSRLAPDCDEPGNEPGTTCGLV